MKKANIIKTSVVLASLLATMSIYADDTVTTSNSGTTTTSNSGTTVTTEDSSGTEDSANTTSTTVS